MLLGSLVAVALAAPRACEGDCRCADTASGPVCFVAQEVPWEGVQGRVAVVVGDVGRDGRADAVVVGCTNNNTVIGDCGPRRVRTITWSDGALAAGEEHPMAEVDPERLVLADVDGDRRADLVGCQGSLDSRVVVLPGDGKGGFADPTELGAPCIPALTPAIQPSKKGGRVVVPRGTSLVRLDDGVAEVVAEGATVAVTALAADDRGLVSATMTGRVTVYEEHKGSLSVVHTVETSVRPRAVHLADLDGDGRDDVLLRHEGDPGFTALLRTATGFGPPQSVPLTPSLPHLTAWIDTSAVGDVDGDGRADAITESVGGSTDDMKSKVLLWLADGQGGLHTPPVGRAEVLVGHPAWAVGAGDLDGDGRSDVVVAGPKAFTVLLGAGAE